MSKYDHHIVARQSITFKELYERTEKMLEEATGSPVRKRHIIVKAMATQAGFGSEREFLDSLREPNSTTCFLLDEGDLSKAFWSKLLHNKPTLPTYGGLEALSGQYMANMLDYVAKMRRWQEADDPVWTQKLGRLNRHKFKVETAEKVPTETDTRYILSVFVGKDPGAEKVIKAPHHGTKHLTDEDDPDD